MLLGSKGDAAHEIYTCFSMMYLSPLWIPSARAKKISDHGMRYLKLYAQLASKANQEGKPLFLYNAKIHMLTHVLWNLGWESEMADSCMNPMIWGVQLDEDLIGKASRITRHVSATPYFTMFRTLQRWLITSHKAWVQEGMLTRCD